MLRYNVEGGAFVIKQKYLKAGEYESVITLSGIKPNVINYIGKFVLNGESTVIKNPKKNPISVNKYSEFIDDKIYPYKDSGNQEMNTLNSRIEMIKFQVKNYFIENNKNIQEIEQSVSKNDITIENMKNDINKRIATIEKTIEVSNIDELIKDKFELKERVDQLKVLIDQNNDDNRRDYSSLLSKLNENSNSMAFKINESTTENVVFKKNVLDKFDRQEDINEQQDSINKNTLDKFNEQIRFITEIEEKTDFLDEKINKKITERSSNIWSNVDLKPYEIAYHRNTINLNFITASENYKQHALYLLKDTTGLTLPYYCSIVKGISNSASTAKLFSISTIGTY